MTSSVKICGNCPLGFSEHVADHHEPPHQVSGKNIHLNNNNNMISSFVSVIEGTKSLSLSEEKERSPQHKALGPPTLVKTIIKLTSKMIEEINHYLINNKLLS